MKRIKKVLAVLGTALFLGGLIAGCAPTTEVGLTPEEINQIKESAKAEVDITADNAAVIEEAVADKDAEIDRLNQVIADYEEVEAEVIAEEETKAKGYIIDDLEIAANFMETLSDREVDKLLDTEIEFDNDDYDIEEVITLTATVGSNEEDFMANTYLQINEGGINYEVQFDNELDTSKIDEDETLVFDFLGKEVEIIEWNVDEVTFIAGEELLVEEGREYTTEAGTIKIQVISDDYVYITVGDNSVKVEEGDIGEVNGVEIKVNEVMDDDEIDYIDKAEIVVAEDIEKNVEDGDDYSDAELWVWNIDANSIGISLNNDYVELDEDYMPLAVTELLTLPNDYVTVEYSGLIIDDSVEITFEDDIDYNVEIRGAFVKGLEDYDRLYVNATGFYDEDDDFVGTIVEVDKTDSDMEIDGNFIKVEDVSIKWTDLSKIKVDGTNICDFEDNYLSNFGIIIDSPEDSCDDAEYSITLPEEKQSAEVSVY